MLTEEDLHFEIKQDILIARYTSGKTIIAEIAKNLVEKRKEFTQGKPYKIVFVFPKLTNMDKGGRDYLSLPASKEGVLASAIVINSILGRVIINFFLKHNNNANNEFPTKVFSNEAEALKWINEIS